MQLHLYIYIYDPSTFPIPACTASTLLSVRGTELYIRTMLYRSGNMRSRMSVSQKRSNCLAMTLSEKKTVSNSVNLRLIRYAPLLATASSCCLCPSHIIVEQPKNAVGQMLPVLQLGLELLSNTLLQVLLDEKHRCSLLLRTLRKKPGQMK